MFDDVETVLNSRITFEPKFKPGDLVLGNVEGYQFAGKVEHLTLRPDPTRSSGFGIYYGVRREHGLGGYCSDVQEYAESFLSIEVNENE